VFLVIDTRPLLASTLLPEAVFLQARVTRVQRTALVSGAPRSGPAPLRSMEQSSGAVAQSLRRFQRAGYELDWRNPDHVAAYQLARESGARVSPQAVLAILQSKQLSHQSAATFSSDFWLVPRSNFQHGLPPEVASNVVSEDELVNNYAVPAEFDLAPVLVVDTSCPRSLLGPRVKKMSFQDSLQRQFTQSAAASAFGTRPAAPVPTTPLADTSGPSGGAADQAEGSAPERSSAPARSSAPVRSSAPPRSLATAAAGSSDLAVVPRRPAPENTEGPAPKVARVLRMMGSDPQPLQEKEANDWQMLLSRISECAKAGSFWSPDVSCSSTVFFWVRQVCSALRAAAGKPEQAKSVDIFTQGFQQFLLKVSLVVQWVGPFFIP